MLPIGKYAREIVALDAVHKVFVASPGSQTVSVIEDLPSSVSQFVGAVNSASAGSAFNIATTGQSFTTVDFDDGATSDGQSVTSQYAPRGSRSAASLVGRQTISPTAPHGRVAGELWGRLTCDVDITFSEPVASIGLFANDIEADTRVRVLRASESDGAFAVPAAADGATNLIFGRSFDYGAWSVASREDLDRWQGLPGSGGRPFTGCRPRGRRHAQPQGPRWHCPALFWEEVAE